MQKDVRKLNDKANTCLEQMEFQVKFLDDDASIQDKDLVMTKVGHFLHSLIMTEDINTFQTGSHLEHLFKAHAWEKDMHPKSNSKGDNMNVPTRGAWC